VSLQEVQIKRFWDLAYQDTLEDVIVEETLNALFLRNAARHLRRAAGVDAYVQWVALHPFRLYVRIHLGQGPVAASKLAAFFNGEGWLEEISHWRDGVTPYYVLDVRPKIVVSS
jgi:hypothetical protein